MHWFGSSNICGSTKLNSTKTQNFNVNETNENEERTKEGKKETEVMNKNKWSNRLEGKNFLIKENNWVFKK